MINHNVIGKLLWLPVAVLLMQPARAATAKEETFNVLKTRTATYTNVTVTKKTKNWIFILHATGMCNIRIQDLPLEIQKALGYGAPPEKAATAGASGLMNWSMPKVTLPEIKALGRTWRQRGPAEVSRIISTPRLLYTTLGILAGCYLFFSYCCLLICRKTHSAAGALIWVPVLQLVPLLRAADMPQGWLLAFFVPVLNVFAQIVWYFKIVKARGKSLWVALLLLLPPTSPFAFLYLAFSSAAPVEFEGETGLMVLETDTN